MCMSKQCHYSFAPFHTLVNSRFQLLHIASLHSKFATCISTNMFLTIETWSWTMWYWTLRVTANWQTLACVRRTSLDTPQPAPSAELLTTYHRRCTHTHTHWPPSLLSTLNVRRALGLEYSHIKISKGSPCHNVWNLITSGTLQRSLTPLVYEKCVFSIGHGIF